MTQTAGVRSAIGAFGSRRGGRTPVAEPQNYPGTGPLNQPRPGAGYGTGYGDYPATPTAGIDLADQQAIDDRRRALRGDRSRPVRIGSHLLTATSVVIVIGLWAAHGGVTDLAAAADRLTSAGRLTGLVSADLLMVQVVMMARIPLLERAFGQDVLVRGHRLTGTVSFTLLIAHILLISAGYATGTGKNVGQELLELIRTFPDMLPAAAGTGLLIMIVVTSMRAVRNRLRYETWHLTHLYAYLGIGLALPHQLSTGADFAESPLATTYWWTVYAIALGAVLFWRIGIPVYRSLRHGLIVDRVVLESPDVVSVYVAGRDLGKLRANAGQFFVWRFLDGRGWTRGNPYSLSAVPSDRELRLTAKEVGDGSARLARLKPGTKVLIEGPYGRMHAGVRTQRQVLLVAAGIGITPMRSLLENLDVDPGELTVLYRARDQNDVVLAPEIDLLAAVRGAQVHYLVGPRRRSWRRTSWLPNVVGDVSDVEALERLVPGVRDHDVYVCGPDDWTRGVRHTLVQAGVPPSHIHGELFTW